MEDDQSKIVHENILNFKSKDENFVLNSIRQIGKIVEVLGQDRTITELLPYLQELLNEHTAIVSALLDGLSTLPLDYNKKEVFSGVCYFFEEVCCFQERGLRAQSVQGLSNLMSKVTSNGSKINLIQILSRLRSTGNLEKRLTATKLLPKIAELLKGQEELFKNVLEFSREIAEDESLEVRSILLEHMPKIIACAKQQHEKQIRNLLTLCLEKGPDFIRAQTVACILSLAQIDTASATALLKTSASLSDWRVRYAICSRLESIGELFGPAIFTAFLTKNISDYLLDQNADTRIVALDCLETLCKYVEVDPIAVHILPCLSHVANDTEVAVRVALGCKMPLLVPKMGKRKFNEFFLPLVLSLLRDESIEVKASIIQHFSPIFEVIGPTVLMDAVDPAISDLSKCVLWRHKKTCLYFLCRVAEAGGKEAVKDSLVKILSEMVADIFESVREAVIETAKKLREVLGEEWVAEKLLNEIQKLEGNQHFKFRVAYVKYVANLWYIFSGETSRKLLQSILSLANDKVPNVRLAVVKTMVESLKNMKLTSSSMRDAIKISLQKLSNDNDLGVAQMAKDGLKELD